MFTRNIVLCLIYLIVWFPNMEATSKKTICLNMIVKNETKVITRCLGTVKPFIDYWVIVDTGSTDGTQEMIKEFMKGVPGELQERPWKNFAHNRNEALELARGKADYVLIIDADEILAFDKGFVKPELDKDFYFIMTEFSGTRYARVQLINNHLDWKWTGVLHETVGCPQAKTNGLMKGITNVVSTDGFRSQDPKKFHKDAQILEEALKEDPNNTRYVFYLAQSYRDAGEYGPAIKNYERRINMGGWDQEIFWSMLQIAAAQQELELPADTFTSSYFKAFLYRPTRAEPIYRLAHYYRTKGNYLLGYRIAAMGLTIPVPDDILFVEHWMYDYGMLLEYSICAYWIEKYYDALAASKKILAIKDLSTPVKECVERNLYWINFKLEELHTKMKENNLIPVTAEKP